MRKKAPKPPAHLREATQSWWRTVVAEYDLEQHHLRLLQLAAEAWDRAEQAREILAREGLTYRDRSTAPPARPDIAIERDSRIAFARLLRDLALDVESPAENYTRPGSIAGRAGLRVS